MGKINKELLYENVSKLIETSREGKLNQLWNEPVKNDRNILNNKPDIISCDSDNGTFVTTSRNFKRGQKYD